MSCCALYGQVKYVSLCVRLDVSMSEAPLQNSMVSRLGSVTARHSSSAAMFGWRPVSQTLQRWTESATYIQQGGHHVGHWPIFLVFYSVSRTVQHSAAITNKPFSFMSMCVCVSICVCLCVCVVILSESEGDGWWGIQLRCVAGVTVPCGDGQLWVPVTSLLCVRYEYRCLLWIQLTWLRCVDTDSQT